MGQLTEREVEEIHIGLKRIADSRDDTRDMDAFQYILDKTDHLVEPGGYIEGFRVFYHNYKTQNKSI